MLMMLLPVVACCNLRTGGLGCCLLVAILVIMLMLTWLVVKPEYLASAQHMFASTGIQVTSAGRPLSGCSYWLSRFHHRLHTESRFSVGLSQLSSIAVTQPYAAYAVLVHDVSSKWNYYLRTNPNINDQLPPLELAIHQKFLSIMISHPPSNLERELLVFHIPRRSRDL